MDSKSSTLVSLAITSAQTMKGSVQHYSDIEIRVPIKGVDQDRNEVNIGDMLLDLYLI